MKQHTAVPISRHDERGETILRNADGEFFANLGLDFLAEQRAAEIVTSYNAHAALVAALESILAIADAPPWYAVARYAEPMEAARAALAAAKGE